jgi:hypothetical protein
MEDQLDAKKEFQKTVNICWATIAALLLCPLSVEILHFMDQSFAGFVPDVAARVKDVVFGLATVLPLFIKGIRKAFWRHVSTKDARVRIGKVRILTAVTMFISTMPALLGFSLFLMGGLYREFYASLAYSALVIFIYFPRFHHWQIWVGTGASIY